MVDTLRHLDSHLTDNLELYDMVKAEGDIDSLAAIETEALNLEPLQTMVGLVHGLVSPGR